MQIIINATVPWRLAAILWTPSGDTERVQRQRSPREHCTQKSSSEFHVNWGRNGLLAGSFSGGFLVLDHFYSPQFGGFSLDIFNNSVG